MYFSAAQMWRALTQATPVAYQAGFTVYLPFGRSWQLNTGLQPLSFTLTEPHHAECSDEFVKERVCNAPRDAQGPECNKQSYHDRSYENRPSQTFHSSLDSDHLRVTESACAAPHSKS